MVVINSYVYTAVSNNISSLESLSDVTVPYNTLFSEVQLILPLAVTATLANGSTVDLPVTWSAGSYSPTSANTYAISGTLTLEGGVTNTGNIQPSVNVILQASKLAGERVYYNADALSLADEATIVTFTDQLGNFNGTGGNTPKFNIESAGGNNVKSYRDDGNTYISMGTTGDGSPSGTGLVDRSFHVFFDFSTVDGRQVSGIQILGGRGADTNRIHSIFINSSGDLVINWGLTGSRWVYTCASVIGDNERSIQRFDIKVDFENDAVTVRRNGLLISGSFTSGNINTFTPGNYDNPGTLVFGNINADGSYSTNTSASYIYKIAYTSLKTTTEAKDIQKEFIRSMYRAWVDRFNVTPSNYATERQAIKDFLWNGRPGGPPTATTVNNVQTSHTGNMHGLATADISDITSWTRLTVVVTDNDGWDWTYYIYHGKNSSPNGKLMIVHRGHDTENPTSTEGTINDFTDLGYDILLCAMPVSSPMPNGENTIEGGNPYSAGHEELFADGLIDDNYSAGHLWFDSQIQSLNYILANPGTYGTYTQINAAGLSGGGWTTLMWAAIDTRIDQVFPCRGNRDQSSKWAPFITSTTVNDQEQAPANGDTSNGPQWVAFHEDHSMFDLIALAAQGGRKCMIVSHINDSANLGGFTFFPWEQAMQARAEELGGEYILFMSFEDNDSTHDWYDTERAAIVAEL